MDKKGELYLTRQYEIFDNPNWKSELAKSPEGTEIIKNASSFAEAHTGMYKKQLAKYQLNKDRWPSVELKTQLRRYLPHKNLFSHVVGHLGEVTKEEDKKYKQANPKLQATQRERMFIRLLEGLHKDEAELLINVKDKKLHRIYKGVSSEVVKKAFDWDDNFRRKDV